MLLEAVGELMILMVLVASGYAGIKAYVHHRQPGWSDFVLKRRFAILGLLTLLVVGVKVFEDVLANESGAVDRLILILVRRQIPVSLQAFFSAVTVAGSALVIVPAAVGAAVALVILKHRPEGFLMMASLGTAAILSYFIKTATGRARPDLWDSQWYWGSSFPSGHTLHTAAVATGLALCAARLWPRSASWAMALALSWTLLVALSRLFLGVHWPSDVLAAICLGVFIPLAISMAMDLRAHHAR